MLYATATIPYGALSVTLGRTSRRVLAFFLSGVVVSFSITYCFTGDIKSIPDIFSCHGFDGQLSVWLAVVDIKFRTQK
jgi:hypothetical protein